MFHISVQILEKKGTVMEMPNRIQFLSFIGILRHWFLLFIQHLQDKICVHSLSSPYLGEEAFTFFELKENVDFFFLPTAIKKTISQHGSFNDNVFVA